MRPRSISQILQAYKQNGYELDERPFAMNIFGIRSNSTQSGKFDDILGYIYKDGSGKWNAVQNPGTTDTGTFYLKNIWPGQTGAALLAPGQYKGAYQLGTHYTYQAFVETGGPVTIYRDYNRDAILDFNNGTKETGYFGINLHRANAYGITQLIANHSAGCQVWQNVDDFNNALQFGREHAARYGNRFTYTLFDLRMDFRRKLRYAVYAAAGVSAIYMGYRIWNGASLKQSFKDLKQKVKKIV
jgi:hypothetical protein